MSISEIITKLADSESNRLVSQLKTMIPEAIFGIYVSEVSQRALHGSSIATDGSEAFQIPKMRDGNGKLVIKLCADPDIFDAKYPGNITATITGSEALQMAEKMAEVEGLLICSATSHNSFPLYRNEFEQIRRLHIRRGSHRWWWPFGSQ